MNTVVFDPALERAVRTRPALHLDYDSLETWRTSRMRDGEQVAGALGSAGLLVVSTPRQDVVRVDLDADGTKAASVWLRKTDGALPSDEVRRGMDALFEGRSVDFSGSQPIARGSWLDELEAFNARRAKAALAATTAAASADPQTDVARPRGQRIAGWSLFSIGVASVGAAVGLHVHRGNLGDEFINTPSNLQAAQSWLDARVAVWTLAAVGGVSTTAAMPLLLPNRERTPWWGWTLGAAGLGLTAYAIYEGVTMTGCPEPYIADAAAVQACVSHGQEAGRLALALAGAAPLLTVPLVYLFRPLRVDASVSVSGQGAVVQLRREF